MQTTFQNLSEAKTQYDKIFYSQDFKRPYEERAKELNSIVTCICWQDSMANFNLVLKGVLKEFTGKVIEKQVSKPDRKNRRDIFILTTDNLKFKELYVKVLNQLSK